MNRFLTAVVTAAGSGSRMGGKTNKLFLELAGKTILERTLDVILSVEQIDHVVVVVREKDEGRVLSLLEGCNKPYTIAYGGETREQSTFNGLKAMPKQTEVVLTHDGARPFILKSTIEKALEATYSYKAVVVGVPAKDTMKQVRSDMTVEATPNRAYLYHVQTPQIFDVDVLLKAYHMAEEEEITVTDDSQLVEVLGYSVKLVIGEYDNFKITTREDLYVAERLLKERELCE